MPGPFYAHSLPGKPPEEWQSLEEHLRNVAELARSFASRFEAGDWGYLAGLWHDIGKYSREFQSRLLATLDYDAHIETKQGRVNHSSAGAQHANRVLIEKGKGKALAYIIAGHHAGMPDGKTNDGSCLANRLQGSVPDYSFAPDAILGSRSLTDLPFPLERGRACFQISFFIRMIFSCLVDADFLDTERFIDKDKACWRRGYPDLDDLNGKLTKALEVLKINAANSKVNRFRDLVLQECIAAADWNPGLFSLTVPTGGGKTLSSLAFALRHALRNKKERIIYVIPYTSIIEQNAAVFRAILGDDAVLEHHSNYEPDEEDHRSRLAAENWDAPVIVTTNVQFFESMFSSRTSRCRRLHNIANSVVILDEAQMLPIHLLKPSLEAVRELATNYRTSVVLCTATQPALSKGETFKEGLDNIKEIITHPVDIYNALRRIQIHKLGKVTDLELAEKLKQYPQVLCIVNTRRHARTLYGLIGEDASHFHLSALMCPAHRAAKLKQIREALFRRERCLAISTQIVEAGVDIDFPVVFRSAAGIDSIAQAGGRCNREGTLAKGGALYVFKPETGLPPGHFRQTAETAEMVLRHHDDPLSLEAVEEYFKTLFWMKGHLLDERQIMQDLSEGSRFGDFPFRRVAEKYRVIDENMMPVIIPYDDKAVNMIRDLRFVEHAGAIARKLQRYTVQVYARMLGNLVAAGAVESVREHYWVLTDINIYSDHLGLCPDDPAFREVESLIV